MRKIDDIFKDFIERNGEKAFGVLSSMYSALSGEDIKDIMQDAYVILYNNIIANKVSEPQYPYFLKICINLSLKAIVKHGKHIVVGINDTEIQQKNMISMNKIESVLQACDEEESVINEKKQLVHNAFGEMATRCKELLWSFYADELSWATIATQSGLKNADSAKTAASRCRQTFKEKYNHLRRKS